MSGFIDRATPALQALKAYDPGHDLPALRRTRAPGELVELGSNENAWGPSAKVLAALRGAAVEEAFRYPDPMGLALRRRLADHHDVPFERIVLGNGSHELLMQFAQIFCGPGDELVHSRFGFAVYPISARAVGATPVAAAPYAADAAMPLGHDLDALFAAISPRCRLVCMANPNNPTGTWVTLDRLTRFLERVPRHLPVVVDEAYIEFADAPGLASALALQSRFPNLVVTRTMSKAFAFAGARLGYFAAAPEICDAVRVVRLPYHLSAVTQAAALAALRHADELLARVQDLRAERDATAAWLNDQGLEVAESDANFVLFGVYADRHAVWQGLLDRGVLIREVGPSGWLRVSIGTGEEMRAFRQALVEVAGL